MIGAKFEHLKEKFYRKGILNQQINSKGIFIFLFVVTVFCGFVYLWQINSLATKGYKIKDLEEKVSQIKDQNKKLELEVTELRSSARIAEKLKELNLVEVAKIEYLTANGSVAVNR
jgi:cell division protein FtsL